MRLGLDIRGGVDDEQLAFGAQLGATDAIGGDACMPSNSGYFEFLELVVFRQRVESAGLRPVRHREHALGLDGQDQARPARPRRADRQFLQVPPQHGSGGHTRHRLQLSPSYCDGIRRPHLPERARTRRGEADGVRLRPHQGPPLRRLRRGVRRPDVGQPRVLPEGSRPRR